MKGWITSVRLYWLERYWRLRVDIYRHLYPKTYARYTYHLDVVMRWCSACVAYDRHKNPLLLILGEPTFDGRER